MSSKRSASVLFEADEKDFAILGELKEDGRQSTADIARSTHLPRVTVHERIRKMRERGVIRCFAALPDYAKLGQPVTAFVFVSYLPGPTSQREVADKIAKLENVFEVFVVSGEWDLLLKVRGKSMEEIGGLVIDRIRSLPGVARTLTTACFTTIKESP